MSSGPNVGNKLPELLKAVWILANDGKRDLQADLDLHDKLLTSGHLSPFEHVARPAKVLVGDTVNEDAKHVIFDKDSNAWCGNFRGWIQLRKLIPNESDILGGHK